jgi:hypothetical protein
MSGEVGRGGRTDGFRCADMRMCKYADDFHHASLRGTKQSLEGRWEM